MPPNFNGLIIYWNSNVNYAATAFLFITSTTLRISINIVTSLNMSLTLPKSLNGLCCNTVKSLRDLEPVLNSVRYSMNNAFLEGNVNRLKMIKRTMYGRAGYDLLGAKVLNGVFKM